MLAREEVLDRVVDDSHDDWQWDGGTMSSDMLQQAMSACPARRTCAEDGVVAEAWAVAVEVYQRVCAAFAWAANQRVANDTESAMQMDDDGRRNSSGRDNGVHDEDDDTNDTKGITKRPRQRPSQR